MPHQLAHHRVPGRLGDLLHGVPDVAHVVPGPRLIDPCGERFLRHAEQPLGIRTHLADRKRCG